MTAGLIILFKCIGAGMLAVAGGFGAIEFINRMPASWLTDYGEAPSEELLDRSKPRVKRTPWAYLCAILLVICYIKAINFDLRFFVPAAFAIWLLMEMAICDIKYRIVPDQLNILLAVSALGFIPFIDSWKDAMFGAAAGFMIMVAMGILGRIIYKKDGVGGADIKVFAVLGLMSGVRGVLTIFILSTLASVIQLIYMTIVKKRYMNDHGGRANDLSDRSKAEYMPMLPAIAVAATVYISFLWNMWDMITI